MSRRLPSCLRGAGAALLAALVLPALAARAAPLPEWFQPAPEDAAVKPVAEPPALDPARRAALRDDGQGHVDRLWRTAIRLRANGDVELRTVLVRDFLSEAGVAAGGNMEIVVDAARERVVLEHAYTRTPDGERLAVPLPTLQVDDASHPYVFSDAKRVVVPYPGLAPGATAVLVITRVHHAQAWPLPWGEVLFFQSTAPIEERVVQVSWERGVAAPQLSRDPDITCERAVRRVTCRGERVAALALDASVASYADLMPQLALTTVGDWTEFAHRVRALVEPQAVPTPALRSLAERLTAGAGTPRERLAALYRFVSDDVRYVAMEHGASAVVPRPAEQTLSQRYGDCKDKVTLLLALARAVGLDAWPMLASFQRYDLARLTLPDASYFDHMIACVALPGEPEPVCVDPTLMRADLELPVELHGAVALALAEGPQRPRTLPRAAYGWQVALDERVKLDCQGRAWRASERHFSGPASLTLRALLLGASRDERQRFFAREYHDAVAQDESPRFAIEDLDEPRRPFAVRFEIDQSIGPAGATEHYDVDPWLITYARSLLAENRVHPYRMPGLRYRAVQTFAPCAEHPVRFTGARLLFDSEFGRLRRHYEAGSPEVGPGVRVVTEFETPARDLSAEQLERFRRFVTAALSQTTIWIGLE